MWSGLALGSYVIGLSYLARRESTRGTLQYWPFLPLGAPILLAFVVNAGPFQVRSLVLALALTLWIVSCLRHSIWAETVQVGRTVAGLLAGIVLVDLLALGGGQHYSITLVFAVLFLLGLVLQRFIPAT
jgi:4-hydroxybenzoate polyprenyltransferase